MEQLELGTTHQTRMGAPWAGRFAFGAMLELCARVMAHTNAVETEGIACPLPS